MYSYALLEKDCYYLIQEKEEDPISLIKVNLETDHCIYVSRYTDSTAIEWKKKTDPIFDILELLEENKVKDWQSIYDENQGSFNYEEDED